MASRSGVKLRAVADTGPLLAAVQCGRVDLLQAFYEVLFATPAQVAELERHGAGEEVQRLIADGFLVVVPLTEEELGQAREVAKAIAVQAKTKGFDAHLPEAQAIVLTMRSDLNAAHILLEESAARAVAKALGVEFTGFVGVVIAAARRGLLTPEEVREILETCRRKGTFYSDTLVETAVRLARGET